MERNSDIVKMSSFAPLLEHFDMAEWSVSDTRISLSSPFARTRSADDLTRIARPLWSKLNGRIYYGIYFLLGAKYVLYEPWRHSPPSGLGFGFWSCVLGGIFKF